MKTGRNDPCPCGSGQKYKKCCYLKEENSADLNLELPGIPNSHEDDDFADEEFWLKAITGFRRSTLDRKAHIKEYYKIRKMHGEVVNAMAQYHEDGKFKQKINTDSVSSGSREKTLSLFESSFDLETRAGSHGFYDMLIYKTAPNMSCIIEDFIQNHRYRKSEKIEFLQSMLASKLGLFEITGTDSKEGYAYLKEVFTGAEYTIIDVGLSGEQNYDDFYIYTRLITYHDISFGTGLNLIFTKNDSFIKNHIRHHRKDYNINGEMLRFIQLYNRYSKYPDKAGIVVNMLK